MGCIMSVGMVVLRELMSDRLDDVFADYPVHLSVGQLAELLGIQKSTAYKWLNQGRIPAYKIGGAWVILRDEVKDALISSRHAPDNRADS